MSILPVPPTQDILYAPSIDVDVSIEVILKGSGSVSVNSGNNEVTGILNSQLLPSITETTYVPAVNDEMFFVFAEKEGSLTFVQLYERFPEPLAMEISIAPSLAPKHEML